MVGIGVGDLEGGLGREVQHEVRAHLLERVGDVVARAHVEPTDRRDRSTPHGWRTLRSMSVTTSS